VKVGGVMLRGMLKRRIRLLMALRPSLVTIER
jgi:hypothetical protein